MRTFYYISASSARNKARISPSVQKKHNLFFLLQSGFYQLFQIMKIWEADVLEGQTDQMPGTIVKVEKDGFCVQTGTGLIKVLSLQIPGKKRMDAGAFLRGYPMEEGTVLSSGM